MGFEDVKTDGLLVEKLKDETKGIIKYILAKVFLYIISIPQKGNCRNLQKPK